MENYDTRSCLQSRSQSRARGRELELRIERVFDQLNALNLVLAIQLNVRQVRPKGNFIYTKKQPFDFLVMTRKQDYCFDAKECCERVWYPSHAPEHQLRALREVKVMGRRSAWLIWFRGTDDPTKELRWVEALETPATVTSGEIFDWGMFL